MMLRRVFWSDSIELRIRCSLFFLIGVFLSIAATSSHGVELLAEYTLAGKHPLTHPITPDGKHFVASGQDDEGLFIANQGLYLIDINTGKIAQTLETDRTAFRHAFSPDGSKILYTTLETIILRDISTGEILHDYKREGAMALRFLSDGKTFLASNGIESTIDRIDTISGETLQSYPIENIFTFFIGQSPDETTLLYFAPDKGTFIDAASGEIIFEFGEQNGMNAVDLTRDFSTLGILTRDNAIHIWNVAFNDGVPEATRSATLDEAKYQFPTVTPNGRYILTGYNDKNGAHFIDIETGNIIESLPHNKTVELAVLSPDGNKAFSVSMEDNTYKLWDVSDLALTDIDDWSRYE